MRSVFPREHEETLALGIDSVLQPVVIKRQEKRG